MNTICLPFRNDRNKYARGRDQCAESLTVDALNRRDMRVMRAVREHSCESNVLERFLREDIHYQDKNDVIGPPRPVAHANTSQPIAHAHAVRANA